jgi:hypothetical protein
MMGLFLETLVHGSVGLAMLTQTMGLAGGLPRLWRKKRGARGSPDPAGLLSTSY